MIRFWKKDPKKEVEKRLGKLYEKHERIVEKKSAERCESFLGEIEKLLNYVEKEVGTGNQVYTWLDILSGSCHTYQTGGRKKRAYPSKLRFRSGRGRKMRFFEIDPEKICIEFSKKLKNLRDDVLPELS